MCFKCLRVLLGKLKLSAVLSPTGCNGAFLKAAAKRLESDVTCFGQKAGSESCVCVSRSKIGMNGSGLVDAATLRGT